MNKHSYYIIDSNKQRQDEYNKNKKQIINNKIEEMSNNIFCENIIEYNIFINMSTQSNGYVNLINDKKKYLNKKIRLYFHKLKSIDRICDIDIKDNNDLQLLIDIIMYSDFDYYTPMIDVINRYIEQNNIINHVIYY